MDNPDLQRYRKYLIAGIVIISVILIVINFEWISTYKSALSVASLRGNILASSTDFVNVTIAHGSDAYYALSEVRESLVADIRVIVDELRVALVESGSNGQTQVSRGIVVFLPVNIAKFEKELKALFLSVAVMRTYQPAHVKTDLIVGTPRAGFPYPESLGCTRTLRTNFDDPERCIVVEHVPLLERPWTDNPLKEYANYIDSMLVLSEFSNPQGYMVLMRTDLDTFVTPGFGKWTLPSDKVLVTGHGGYGSENSEHHLSWIIKSQLGLVNAGLKNVGSTWVGNSKVMVATAKLTVASMVWLHTQEFSIYEKKHSGTDGWPHWHWPVLLLYGGHIAVNQIPLSRVFVTNLDTELRLDYGTTTTTLMTDSILHIHCWHTDDLFSKFRFSLGQYKELDLEPFLALNSSQSYATSVAVSSDRIPNQEFALIVNDSQKMKDKDWIRQKYIV